MAKKRKKKTNQPEEALPPPAPMPARDRIRGYLFRPRVLLLAAMAVSATFMFPVVKSLLPDLSEQSEFCLPTSQIQIGDTPHWVPQNLVEQVMRQAGLPDQLRMLDSDLTRRVAEAFQMHPWVAEVVRVEKAFPPKIEVTLEYRRPVAMVQVKQGMYPVDAQGVLLPPADFSVTDTQLYPVIQNVSSMPQGPAGTNWGDVSVAGAAHLAHVLLAADGKTPHWKRFHLAAIWIPKRSDADLTIDDVTYELITQGGSRIIWGRAPGTDHPGELSPEQKLGRLERYLSEFHSFEAPHGPYEIDIRHWQEISRRPLTASRSSHFHR